MRSCRTCGALLPGPTVRDRVIVDAGIGTLDPVKIDDRRLLRYFLDRGHPDAAWNLSPDAAFLDYKLRSWTERVIGESRGRLDACNIGIGTGDWDDFLGYAIAGRGTLTSIDIDPEICAVLRYRQRRQGHTNPATVRCRDLLRLGWSSRFDLVTIVGSTVAETGAYDAALTRALELLRPRGRLFYADFDHLHAPSRFAPLARTARARILRRHVARTPAGLAFYAVLAAA
jgi:SAM-dependent methyltransferase